MDKQQKESRLDAAGSPALSRTALRSTMSYVVVASVWILFSDFALGFLVHDQDLFTVLSVAKGWIFVGFTGILLYILTLHDLRSLAAASAAENRNRALLQAIIDGTSDAVFVKDLQGQYLLFNAAAGRMVGKDPASVIGRDDTYLFPPDDALAIKNADLRVLEHRITSTFEENIVLEDGERHVFLSTKGPIFDGVNRVIGMFCIARDITDRKHAEEELAYAGKMAEAASRSKSEFLAMVSHEMRTPLAGMLGMIDLILDGEPSEEERRLLETAKRCGETLLRLITDMVNFSALQNGNVTLEYHQFEMAPLMQAAIRTLEINAREKGLEVRWEVDPAVPSSIRGDEGRILQVLLNLIDNAIKFTQQGEIVAKAEILHNEERGEDEVLFSVRDTGIGITADQSWKIFQRFTQVDSSSTRRYGGLGLGLALSKGIVETMGGRMWVESRFGVGSTFYFTVPLKPAGTS